MNPIPRSPGEQGDAARLAADADRVATAYARRGYPARESMFADGHLFLIQEQGRALLRALRRAGITDLTRLRTLEVGCGTGRWLCELVSWGAEPGRLTGIDLLAERIDVARRRCARGVALHVGNGGALPFEDGSFDLVLQSTVFTSILDGAVRRHVADEIVRVLRPGGTLLWYDFRFDNPRNPDVRAVGRRELAALFPGCRMQVARATLAPPLARLVAPRSWTLCTLLAALPFLRTHLVATIRTPEPQPAAR